MSRALGLAFLVVVALVAAQAAAQGPKISGYRDSKEAEAAARELSKLGAAQRRGIYKAWKKQHGEAAPDGTPEDDARFATFSSNLQAMVEHNSKPGAKFFKGLNKFSDLTFADFKETYLMEDRDTAELADLAAAAKWDPEAAAGSSTRKLLQKPSRTPTAFSWASQGKVPPVRDQGGCGSCWAFASIAAMEIKASIDGVYSLPDLSEQQMVDCVVDALGFYSMGCIGGYSHEPFIFAYHVFSSPESLYPYTATDGVCQTPPGTPPPSGALKMTTNPGYTTLAADAATIMQAVSSQGPVVVYFSVVDSFYSYTGGVYQASECNGEQYNHAMVVTGYNATMGVGHPESYWIVRNSWGTGWGEGGNAKIQMTSTGACSMYSYLLLPTATSNPNASTTTTCKSKKC